MPQNNPHNPTNPTIKRALVSVTDKTGLTDFCRVLVDEFGIELVSTGGTARTLADAGIAVTPIEDVTGFPEMMDGRVKTLHPKVHGGLLARREDKAHMQAATEHDIAMIDLVVVNLYAFEETIARAEVTQAEAIENIDIGGPSMLRSAAKNFASVTVVSKPEYYAAILEELRGHAGATTLATRQKLAQEVFATTASYDAAIAGYLAGAAGAGESGDAGNASNGETFHLTLTHPQPLRYGENPHQRATFYRRSDAVPHTLATAKQLQGKELSYNNILDTDGAWSAVREFSAPTCVIVKHTNPCGVASCDAANDENLVQAYQRAWEGDPVSAYGGIIALNRPVTAEIVQAIFANKQFVEVIIAPSFDSAALELFATKPNVRVLTTGGVNVAGGFRALRSVEGGVLVQDEDAVAEDPANFRVASKRQPTTDERAQLLFAWKISKSVKSNAIVLARELRMTGMGAGQPNRVNSARIAVEQAGDLAATSVAASDAFVPFPDTVELLAEAGVTALIQPGGSIRDEEVLTAADQHDMAVLFTATRHFRH